LNLAKQCGASKFLLVSSGAVYGPFPEGMTHVPETYFGGPDPLLKSSAYGEGKRVSEWLVSQAATNKFEVKIARVFALVGPHLPLNKHFAIGNFIFQALKGEAISIQGDGTPYRSYLYTADMAAWLWAILLRGQNKCAYNVGSDQSISIKELAEITCRILSCHQLIQIEKSSINDSSREIYVPNNFKIVNDLELIAPLSLEEAILRTSNWWNKFLDKIS
jgi:dTDP-glucose 4,6-dehydratase